MRRWRIRGLRSPGWTRRERFGVAASVAVARVVVLVASVVLSVLRSLVTYGNLVLRRDADVLHLEHGLLRVREHTFDMRRLRGGRCASRCWCGCSAAPGWTR